MSVKQEKQSDARKGGNATKGGHKSARRKERNMKRYLINGFREGKNYFFRLGRFTEEEIERLENGEIVTKGENEFYIDEQ